MPPFTVISCKSLTHTHQKTFIYKRRNLYLSISYLISIYLFRLAAARGFGDISIVKLSGYAESAAVWSKSAPATSPNPFRFEFFFADLDFDFEEDIASFLLFYIKGAFSKIIIIQILYIIQYIILSNTLMCIFFNMYIRIIVLTVCLFKLVYWDLNRDR